MTSAASAFIDLPPFTISQSLVDEKDFLNYLLTEYKIFQQGVYFNLGMELYTAPRENLFDVFAKSGQHVTLFPSLTQAGLDALLQALQSRERVN